MNKYENWIARIDSRQDRVRENIARLKECLKHYRTQVQSVETLHWQHAIEKTMRLLEADVAYLDKLQHTRMCIRKRHPFTMRSTWSEPTLVDCGYADLGWANGWGSKIPPLLRGCREAQHIRRAKRVGNHLTRTVCDMCHYFYLTDSSG